MSSDTERRSSQEELKMKSSIKAAESLTGIGTIDVKSWHGLVDMVNSSMQKMDALHEKLDGVMTNQVMEAHMQTQARAAAQQRQELTEVISDLSRQAGSVSADFSSRTEAIADSAGTKLRSAAENTQTRLTAILDRCEARMNRLTAKMRTCMLWTLVACEAALVTALVLFALRMRLPV